MYFLAVLDRLRAAWSTTRSVAKQRVLRAAWRPFDRGNLELSRPVGSDQANTLGGPVPRRAAAVDAPWGVRVFRAPVQGTADSAAAPCQRGISEWRMNATGSWASIGHPRHHVRVSDGGQGLAEMAAWMLKSTGATPVSVVK